MQAVEKRTALINVLTYAFPLTWDRRRSLLKTVRPRFSEMIFGWRPNTGFQLTAGSLGIGHPTYSFPSTNLSLIFIPYFIM